MSQYNSPMFSDAVYLFGATFSPGPSWFGLAEELPDGTWVDQKKLAEQAVLAAFAYLYNKKLIDIVLVERKSLFGGKMMAIVKKLQSSPLDTSGLEAAIFAHVQDNVEIYDITRELLPGSEFGFSWQVGHKPLQNVRNPWGDILQIVKKSLLHKGILKPKLKKERFFLSTTYTYKYVVNEDISKEEKQVTELKKTLKELQSKGVLYGSAIRDGISSRQYRPSG